MCDEPHLSCAAHGLSRGAAVLLSLLCASGSAVAGPELRSARSWLGDPTGAYTVSTAGPITVEPRSADSLTIWMSFSEPLLGFRRVDVTGGTLSSVNFVPGRNWVTVDVQGIESGAAVSATIVDAVGGSGITPASAARVSRRDGDFFPDGVVSINDIISFAQMFGAGSLLADGNVDGQLSVDDLFWFIDLLNGPAQWGDLAPLVTTPKAGFAPNGRWSRWIPFTVRDDVTAESNLVITSSVSPAGIVPAAGVQVEGTGAERRVRFLGTQGGVGQATITLNVSDGTNTTPVRFVASVGPDIAPTARITTRDFLGVAPLTVELSAEASSDSEDNIASYAWGFGGGVGQTNGARATATFTAPGTYVVTCRVTDDSGLNTQARRVITVAASAYDPATPVTSLEARRFLWQAAFGPTDEDAAFVEQVGYDGWIAAQFAEPANYFSSALQSQNATVQGVSTNIANLWDDFCVEGRDQLRQRLAWALIQTIAIRTTDSSDGDRWLYNVYIKHALGDAALGASGNYRELIEEITYTGAMGSWLTYKNNKKADAVLGNSPDENYARELMQLFTIGLWVLEPDGTRKRDLFGEDVPTYTNEDIGQFARVFTGLVTGEEMPGVPRNEGPMAMRLSDHEFNDKLLLIYPGVFDGTGYIPAAPATQENAARDIRLALDNVFNHPSFAPFIAELMIKRFVTSNPTRAYVGRVAQAFAGSGPFGSGVRGDMRALIRAVLLDDEARNPAYRGNPMYGRVREPLAVLMGVTRALGQSRFRANAFPFRVQLRSNTDNWPSDTGQGFMQTPSVFNFYQPDYAPVGSEIEASGLTAPELQIFNDFTALAQIDQWRTQIVDDEDEWDPALYARLVTRSVTPRLLMDELERVLVAGTLSRETKLMIQDTVARLDGDRDRIRSAVYLLLANPEFRVLR